MTIRACLVACLLLLSACSRTSDAPAPAQVVATPTQTDIWLVERLDSGRGPRVGTPVNVTNRAGYDNQPAFLADGSGFLYTSNGADGQADIWRYEIARGRKVQVTRTLEGEYSPTPMGAGFSAVRVEMDGRQRLWWFDDDGQARLLFEDIAPVGYHSWFDDTTVGLFVLGDPPTLLIANTETGRYTEALRSVGRSMHAVPGEATVSVVHKLDEEVWRIVEVDTEGNTRGLGPVLRPGEDFAWTPDGFLLMGRGSKLFIRRPGDDQEWQELADFSAQGIGQITRIAVSPRNDRIAFVSNR